MASFPFGFWRLSPSSGNTGLGFRYGYQFDGVDEYINFGNNLNLESDDPFSFSFWINPSNISDGVILSNIDVSQDFRGYEIRLTSGKVRFILSNGLISVSNVIDVRTVDSINLNDWVNISICYNGDFSANNVDIYVDEVLKSKTITKDTLSGSIVNNEDFCIGIRPQPASAYFGRIDDVQIFDYKLTSTNASDIYNSGYVTAPTASPIHHWKLGEEDAFSTDWTVKDSVGSLDGTSVNMEEEDRKLGVAYSMDFDGVDEKINFGNINLFDQYNPFTISLWLKPASTRQGLISKTSSIYNGFVLFKNFSTLRFHFGTNEFNGIQVTSSWTMTPDTWVHVVATFDGVDANGVALYKDSVSGQGVTRNDSIGDVSNTDDLVFGTTDVLGSLNGNMMYVSVFDSELSASDVTTLYNSGVPVDARNVGLNPTFFAPLGGENDSFNGTDWTIVDEINGNNGTSVNMEEADKTSETP